MSKRVASLALLAVALVALCYLPALSVYLIGDDFECLNGSYSGWRDPALLFSGGGLFFRPVLLLTYLVKYTLFGTSAPLHLAATVLIHLVNVALLFVLMVRLTGKVSVPFAVSLLFGSSPLLSEAVVWAGGSSDSLLVTFILGTLLAAEATNRDRRTWHRVAFVLAVLGAVGSKETWVVLPVLLMGFWWLVAELDLPRALRRSLPLFGFALLFVGLRVLASTPTASDAQLGYFAFDAGEMAAKASWLTAAYVGLGERVDGQAWHLGVTLFLTLATALVLFRLRARLALWGLLWTWAAVLVTLPVPYAPPRYNYLPLAGFWIMVGDGVDHLLGALSRRLPRARAVAGAGAVVVTVALLANQVARVQLEIADFRALGDYHRQLVERYQAVRDAIPPDRPLVVVNKGTRRPVQEVAETCRGVRKAFFVRPAALWELVLFSPLANFAGDPFAWRMRPIPPARLAAAVEQDFSLLEFTDRGFSVRDQGRDGLRDFFRAHRQLPSRVAAYELVRADSLDE